MTSEKFTPEERVVAIKQLDVLLDCTEVEEYNGQAYNSAIVSLVCEWNTLLKDVKLASKILNLYYSEKHIALRLEKTISKIEGSNQFRLQIK